jgi:sigma-B regulation protein RsbU (phosphoserine phosphatase)
MLDKFSLKKFPIDCNLLLNVLNYLNAGVYITDIDRHIMLWNNKAEKITGYKSGEVIGKACHEGVLCHIDKNGQLLCDSKLCPLYRSINTGIESQEPILLYAHKKDGKRIAVSVNVAPLRNEAGDIIGGIEIFHDESNSVADLEFAKRIQHGLLPKKLPQSADLIFDVHYFPHDLIGGDFYSIRKLGPKCYGFLVADVSGHGVSAALYTMWLKSIEDSLQNIAKTPDLFVTHLNKQLCRNIIGGSFVTLFYGVLDMNIKQLIYVNAGHTPALHMRRSCYCKPNRAHANGPPIGIDSDFVYNQDILPLNSGDLLLCYTDGITEVFENEKNILGIDGLETIVVKEFLKTSDNFLDRLYDSVMEKSCDVLLSDDVLLLSINVI